MPTLAYQSAPLLPPGFERALESERGRWLRRRFLWYCGLSLGLSVISLLPMAVILLDPSIEHKPSTAYLGTYAFFFATSLVLYIGCYLWAWRSDPDYRSVLRVAVFLFVVGGGWGVLGTRLLFSLDSGEVTASLRESVRESLQERGVDPDSPAGLAKQRIAMYVGASVGNIISVLVLHLLTCLMLPWSVRDAIAPSAAVWAVFSLIVAHDTVRGMPLQFAAPLVLAAATGMVPGLAICWFRYARFTRRLRTRLALDQYRQLQQDLFSARRLHESVLPPPKRHGLIRLDFAYEPMREIGGDLLFVHAPPDQAAGREVLHIVVLDATGHGIGAALTVNRLVGELQRLYSGRDPEPDAVLTSLNEYVWLTLASHGVFATAIALRVEAGPGVATITWSNGGHPPPIVIRVGGRTCERLESQALLLGAVPPGEFEAGRRETALGPADLLVAYTDGANEAADPAGRYLGVDGVEQSAMSLAATGTAELCDALLARIDKYRHSPAADDTLIVVLELGGQEVGRGAKTGSAA